MNLYNYCTPNNPVGTFYSIRLQVVHLFYVVLLFCVKFVFKLRVGFPCLKDLFVSFFVPQLLGSLPVFLFLRHSRKTGSCKLWPKWDQGLFRVVSEHNSDQKSLYLKVWTARHRDSELLIPKVHLKGQQTPEKIIPICCFHCLGKINQSSLKLLPSSSITSGQA